MAEKKAKKKKEDAPPAEPKAKKGKQLCQDCEFCFHDKEADKPKPRCVKADKPLENTGAAPAWCPAKAEPEISEETGMPIPDSCGECEFMAHKDKACVKSGKKIESAEKRNKDCPLPKEAEEAEEE